MKRELKFRAWDKRQKCFQIWEFIKMLPTAGNIIHGEHKNYEPTQFTGLLDKNGNEIYECDIIKYAVKESWCKNEKCETKHKLHGEKFCPRCGEKIEDSDFVRTAEIRFVKGGFCFYEEQHKDDDHTYTAWQTFINEIYIEWIEVVGNIYENADLLIFNN